MSLLTRSFLSAVVPLVLFGLLLFLVLWHSIIPSVQDSVFQIAQEKQRSTRAQVTDFIRSRKNLLESIARNDILKEGPNAKALAFLRSEQSNLTELFEGLYFNELDGTVTPAEGSKFNIADRRYFEKVEKGEPVVGEVITSRATSRRVLLMVVPIYDKGEVAGALGGTVHLSDLLRSVESSPEILHLRVALLEEGKVLEGFPEAAKVAQDPSAYSDQGCRIKLEDQAFRAWASKLPLVSWRLILAWPEQEMLAPFYNALTAGSSSFIVIFILALGSSFWLQRSVTLPLRQAAERLSKYQGDSPLSLKTDGPQEVSFLLKSINDMSRRVSMEMERRTELEQQLAKAVHQERLGTVVDSVAHDFNNVLSAIINLAELCQEEVENGSQTDEDLNTIIQSASMGMSIVKQLRAKAVSTDYETETLVFDQEFIEWEETFRGLLPPNISMKTELGAPEIRTRAVPHHLFQVLLNLVCNARDALADRADGEITVSSAVLGEELVVQVIDNGPGVPANLVERIFEPFFTTRGEGSGLGLSTCHRLIREMNSQIRYVRDDRTRFCITLPVI